MNEIMAYVATDPDQPGAAWAISVDSPAFKKFTAADIARWVNKGAIVQHVPISMAREMLAKWVRP